MTTRNYQIAQVIEACVIISTIFQCLFVTVKCLLVFAFGSFDNAQIHPSGRKFLAEIQIILLLNGPKSFSNTFTHVIWIDFWINFSAKSSWLCVRYKFPRFISAAS